MMSRRQSKQMDDGEFRFGCKAAFLTMCDDIDDRIESKKTLRTLLQTSGRNPSERRLNTYWPPKGKDYMTFSDFLETCRKEPITSVDDLMQAFRRIDTNGDGYISLDELHKIMNKRDEPMTRDEVRKMIDDVDENKDGKLDYSEFSNMIIKTSEESKKFSMKVMERKERKKRRTEKANSRKLESNDQPLGIVGGDTAPSKLGDLGSSVSLSAHQKVDSYLSEIGKGSTIDLRSEMGSDVKGSKVSLRSKSGDLGDKADVTMAPVKERHSSKISLREGLVDSDDSKLTPKALDEDVTGSKVSLRLNTQRVHSSKTSLRSGFGEVHGSKVSLKEAPGDIQGSRVTLKSASADIRGSKVSLRSVSREGPKSSRSEKNEETNADSSLKNKDEDAESEREKSTAEGNGIESARSHQTASEASQSAHKSEESHNSARTVGEEIEYDDDFDIVSTGRPTPRVDLNSSRKESARQTPRTDTQSKPPKKPDKGDLGAPVPSPRKTLSSRLPEDDMPRPSPRLTLKKDSKGKSSSTRSRDKLPDAKSLRDWSKFTSKGCFFYEEDEIVTHVFNLKLRDDSTVFLSAYPIQEPACLNLPSVEPIDTALFIFDSQGKLVTCTEQRDIQGKYGVKVELTAGQYQILPYTTGCRFKQRPANSHTTEATLIDKDGDDNVVIKSEFRRALEQIFDLCDLDDNGTMSYDEFNWFNLRTSGEELEEEEWKVVEERTTLKDGEITKKGFILLNEMEAEDVKGDTEDLWITLTSMGMNKALEMDEACPYRVEVYVEEPGRKQPLFKVTGIESLEKKAFKDEICRYILEKGEPEKVRNMKDLYTCTYKNENRATIVVDNRSRSTVNLEVDCSKSRNVISNHSTLDYTFEVDPQSAAIAHHLIPRSELKEWSINVTETIHK